MTPQDMKQAFPDTMLEVGKGDDKLVVLVGDISHFALKPFSEECPGRFYNVGILEPTIVSMAAGIASVGLYPVAHTITPFLIERSFEQIKLDFCYQGLGGTLISVGSAFDYSTLGCTHHCYDDIALINSLPGTEIVYPASPKELNLLFKQTYSNGNFTYMRMARNPHGVEFSDKDISFGKGIIVRTGSDISLVTTGPQLKTVMESVPLLEREGISAEVLYYPTLKPFDSELALQSAGKTGRALVIEEHVRFGGLTDMVANSARLLESFKFDSLNIPDRFLRNYGTYDQHCVALGFTPENIVIKAKELC